MPRIHGAALNEVDWGGARFDNIPPLIIRLELAQALHPAGKQAPDYAVGDRGPGPHSGPRRRLGAFALATAAKTSAGAAP
jgi:hypothetical protein